MHFVYYKQNGEWHYNLLGTTVDEEEIAGSGIRYIEDQGQTHRFTGEWSIDGDRLDPLRDTYRRLGDRKIVLLSGVNIMHLIDRSVW